RSRVALREWPNPFDPVLHRLERGQQSFARVRVSRPIAALLAAAPSDDPLVLARLAEVEFYLGNIAAARAAAERAIAAAPSLSRPRSILGFADLAQFRFEAAEEAFRG